MKPQDLKYILSTLVEMEHSKDASVKSLNLMQKKLEIALAEGSPEEIEKARVNFVEAFSASLDAYISTYHKANELDKHLRSKLTE